MSCTVTIQAEDYKAGLTFMEGPLRMMISDWMTNLHLYVDAVFFLVFELVYTTETLLPPSAPQPTATPVTT